MCFFTSVYKSPWSIPFLSLPTSFKVGSDSGATEVEVVVGTPAEGAASCANSESPDPALLIASSPVFSVEVFGRTLIT